MNDKLKTKIENLKKDKVSLKEYVTCFCNNKKANEVLKSNVDFIYLKNKTKNTQF